IRDDYATGPLAAEETEETLQARRAWWSNLLEGSPYEEQINLVDDVATLQQLSEELIAVPEEECWIWMGQNAHDVCGYYWILKYLKPFAGRIMVLYMNNLPFLNEKGGIFYPSHLHEILPKEFLKAKKLARPITGSEWEVDPEEWSRLLAGEGMVRLLEGGKKLVNRSIDFHDEEIFRAISSEWQKLNKVIGQLLSKNKNGLTDSFIAWRLKGMVEEGKIEWQDDKNKGWKDTQVRRTAAKEITTTEQ
ncbi:MAG: DUF1835 domain-containing protein, partial [Chitinophagaceae bacterium]|nr:DUF1835 domain-containing protein [Chitinophagaceae bacterium]